MAGEQPSPHSRLGSRSHYFAWMDSPEFNALPLWQRVIVVMLALSVVMLPAVAILAVFLAPVMLWRSFAYSVRWLRWKLLGVLIPPRCSPPGKGPTA